MWQNRGISEGVGGVRQDPLERKFVGGQIEKILRGGVWIFSGTTHSRKKKIQVLPTGVKPMTLKLN